MNKDTVNIITDILKKKWMFIGLVVLAFGCGIYFLGLSETPKAPIKSLFLNYPIESKLKEDIKQSQKDLQKILNDNKTKNEAAKKATIKEFYKATNSDDIKTDIAPLFDNVVTMIKQNGLRMKSINYTNSSDDNLVKNGSGAYSGCRVDFELVGYYTQFAQFMNDLNNYPFFINIAKFQIIPYQYDKKILIANLSIIFYTKR